MCVYLCSICVLLKNKHRNKNRNARTQIKILEKKAGIKIQIVE